jgi:hypothetical protein
VTALQLHDARERGCATASLQSTAMAEGVYASLGFLDLGRHLEYGAAALRRGAWCRSWESGSVDRGRRQHHAPAVGVPYCDGAGLLPERVLRLDCSVAALAQAAGHTVPVGGRAEVEDQRVPP